MATRFYFRENGTAPITPNVDAAWESSASPFARKPMFTTTDGTDTLTTVAGFGSTTGQDRCHRQLISRPMAAGLTFDTAVTYKCYVQGLESATNDNIQSRLGIRILSLDGTVVRHTIKTVADYSTVTEWNTALRNKRFADGDAGVGSYVTVAGDRLVVEIGHSDAAGASISASSRWGSAGSADLGENETSTSTTERPWFETSLNITFVNAAPVGQASETDSAQAIGKSKSKAVGQASETDSAFSITATLGGGDLEIDVNQAIETDSALSITAQKRVTLGIATETDSALGPAVRKQKGVGLASETDSALAMSRLKSKAIGQASETDTAQPLTSRKLKELGLAGETDSAFAITDGGGIEADVGQAVEADTALSFTVQKRKAIGLAQDLSIALSITPTLAVRGLVYRVQSERYAIEHGTPVTESTNLFLEEVVAIVGLRIAAIMSVRNVGTGQYTLERLESTLYPYLPDPEETQPEITPLSGLLVTVILEDTAEVEEFKLLATPQSGLLVTPVILHTLFDVDEVKAVATPQSGLLVTIVIEHTLFDKDEVKAVATPQSGLLVAIVIEHTLFDKDEVQALATPQSGTLVVA